MINIVYTDYNEISITEYGTPVYIPNPTASYVEFSDVEGLSQFSSSISDRAYDLEIFSSSLNASFATDAELNSISQSLNQSIQYVSQSLYAFKLVSNTGSFTGSFTGDGSELKNISASNIVGLTEPIWGAITGSLSNQTDLQSALDAKVDENAPITGATKTKITYDAKGLVTSGSDAGISDIIDLQSALDAKQDDITLTTTGTSGAATLVGSTLNIPQYQSVLTNPVTGTGTAGQVAYWSGTTTQTGDSNLTYNSTNITFGIGTNLPSTTSQVGLHLNNKTIRLSNTTLKNSYLFQGFSEGSVDSNIGIALHAGTTTNSPYLWIAQSGTGGWAGPSTKAIIASTKNGGTTRDLWIYSNDNLNLTVPNLTLQLNTNRVGINQNNPTSMMHIVGSGTTSATTALLVQNSTPSELFKVTDNGLITIGTISSTNTINFGSDNTQITRSSINDSFSFRNVRSAATIFQFITNSNLSNANTSGTNVFLSMPIGYEPTSGTGTWTQLSMTATINQTGGANGITRGLYVNPTLTSAADWRSVEFSNNTGWGIYGAGPARNFLSGSLTLASGLTVTGSITATSYTASSALITGDVTIGGKVTAQEFYTEYVSSSIIYESGSTKFGDTLDDVHQITGSLQVTGSGNHYILGGNVGIGTNTPTQTLDVNGSARFTGITTFSSAVLLNGAVNIAGSNSLNVKAPISAQNLILGYDTSIPYVYNYNGANFGVYLATNGTTVNKGVGIGALSLHDSAIFHITSTTKGALLPRMTIAQRDAISSPAQGLMVYVTSSASEGLYYYNSGSYQGWTKVLTNSGSQSITGSVNIVGGLTNTGPTVLSGSLQVTEGITGSLLGTATSSSYSQYAEYLLNDNSIINALIFG